MLESNPWLAAYIIAALATFIFQMARFVMQYHNAIPKNPVAFWLVHIVPLAMVLAIFWPLSIRLTYKGDTDG